MKKSILFLFLLTIGVSLLQAQSAKGQFKGGVRAGLTTSQVSGDDLAGFHKMGATAGLFANVALNDNDNLKLQMGLDFTMKGSHSHTPKNHVSYDSYVLNLGYLEVPILLQWRFAHLTIRSIHDFWFEFGPMIGVNLYARERNASGPILFRLPFRRMEFSACAGLSYMFNEHHGLNFRFSNSFIPVRIPDWAVNQRIMKQFNTVLSLCYMYQF
ncbi:MAG: PorT family protein [Bacteroidales bacterium]|nr:PorT family protein [Bacteroidales bacterium]